MVRLDKEWEKHKAGTTKEEAEFQKWKGLADRDRAIHTKEGFVMAGMDEKLWERLVKECEWLEGEEQKEQPLDLDVNEALKGSKKPIQRLGQGIHNDIFYYGTTLNWRGKPVSAVVTSEKKIYLGLNYITWKCKGCGCVKESIETDINRIRPPKNCKCEKKVNKDFEIEKIRNPIRNDFGLNYRVEFNEDALDYVWENESIKKYLKNDYEKKTIKEIYHKLLKLNEKYIDHLNPCSHKYTACWTIGTYCYTLFEQFGRLYNHAERGSGKTKQLRLQKFTCFNPMWVTKGTESSQFRDAEATCGTFLVDNMDKLHEDLKRSIEHYIETGWMKEATYRLTDKDSGRTIKFRSFTPLALNNIYGLDENTIDKTFEIPMLKSVNSKIKRLKVTSKSENWEEIRNDIIYWMLDNWRQILDEYESMHGDFSGRAFDVAEGTLTIAKVIDEDLFVELEKYCKEKLEEELVDLENNNCYMVFSKIWMDFQQNPIMEESNIFLSDIADALFDKFNPHLQKESTEYQNKKKGFSKYISKIIKSVPMFRKGGLSCGRTYLRIKREDLHRYMLLQHFINEDGTLLTSTTSTTSTSSTTSTIFNKKEEKSRANTPKVEQVDEVEEVFEVEQVDKSGKTATLNWADFKKAGYSYKEFLEATKND